VYLKALFGNKMKISQHIRLAAKKADQADLLEPPVLALAPPVRAV
jgi:hypothetical protein